MKWREEDGRRWRKWRGGEGGLMFDVLSRSDPSFELLAVSSFNKMFQQHVYHHYHHYCFAAVMKAATRWHLAGENSPLNKNNSAYIQNDWFNRMSIGYWKEPKPKMSLNFSFHLSFFLSFLPSFFLFDEWSAKYNFFNVAFTAFINLVFITEELINQFRMNQTRAVTWICDRNRKYQIRKTWAIQISTTETNQFSPHGKFISLSNICIKNCRSN